MNASTEAWAYQVRLAHLRGEELAAARKELTEARAAESAAQRELAYRLAVVAEYRDLHHEPTHLLKISSLCRLLAESVGMPPGDVEILGLAAPLHDVGKVGVPDAVLAKPGRLTAEETRQMQEHTVLGARLLAGSPSPILQVGEKVALTHHERWDGGGYPRGLAGAEIPLEGRICGLADALTAMSCRRPYREALPFAVAWRELCTNAGRQFDPRLVEALQERQAEVQALLWTPRA